MAHSIEIREKALEYLERCKNVSQVARAYGVSRNTLYCWLDLKQKTGELERRVVKARPRKIDREELAAYINNTLMPISPKWRNTFIAVQWLFFMLCVVWE